VPGTATAHREPWRRSIAAVKEKNSRAAEGGKRPGCSSRLGRERRN
jgi:hypothetical protein